MICFHCGSTNTPGVNYCARCNRVLPRFDALEATAPSSSLEVEDGRAYVVPQQSFSTQYLYDLTCRAQEYIHQGASGEPLLDAYGTVRARIEAFENNDVPTLLARMKAEQAASPDDDYYSQVSFLLNAGIAIMGEGFTLMDQFIESGDVDTLKAAVTKMQEGNDNLGLARRLAAERAKPVRKPPQQ